MGVSVQGYNALSNDIKRAYAFKLSKLINFRSGAIFQKAQGLARGAGKVVSKLGPVGTVLLVGVIAYEGVTGTWDAHTILNGGLLIGAGVATVFAAPAVLTGIYWVADYFFDIGGKLDNAVGRKSGVW